MSEFSEKETISRFIDGLKQAAGCAHQLAHAQRNPKWLLIRDLLEGARNQGVNIATARAMAQHDVVKMIDNHNMLRR